MKIYCFYLPLFISALSAGCFVTVDLDEQPEGRGELTRRADVRKASTLDSFVDVSSSPDAGAAALVRGLATIDPDEIAADLYFIAADEMGGRDTPSAGQRITARFIRARMQRLGWQPGAQDGYFHDYELQRVALDREASKAFLMWESGERELAFGEDYFFFPRASANRDTSGAIVYCGKLTDDDADGLDLEGKWALCYDSDLSWRQRRRNAQQAGAAGLIVAPGPDYDGESYDERYGPMADSPSGLGSSGSRRESFPFVYIDADVLAQIVQRNGSASWEVGQNLGIGFREVQEWRSDESVQLENVCAFWPGSDPDLSDEVIVLSAHYDHVGERANGDIYNGADDNGSGTCGLMALAEALTQYGPMRRSIMLLWVSGEEKGLLGSAAWTKDPWLPGDARAIANINIDMIGRNAPDQLLITPTHAREEYNGLVRVAEENAPLEGFPVLGDADEYWGRSDHANFSRNLSIPVAFLFSDVHEDYHQPSDTSDKVDYDKLHRVVRLVLRMLNDLQADQLDL